MATDFGALGGGIGSIFGGIGGLFSSSAYDQAAKIAKKNAALEKLSTGIQEDQATRKAYELAGTTEAAAGANNLSLSGSAMDVMKANTSQMTLQKNLTAVQGQINVNSWLEKAAADEGAAEASAAGGIGGILGGIFQVAGAVGAFA